MKKKCPKCSQKYEGIFHAATVVCKKQHLICYKCSLRLFKINLKQIPVYCPVCKRRTKHKRRRIFVPYQMCQAKFQYQKNRQQSDIKDNQIAFMQEIQDLIDFGKNNESDLLSYLQLLYQQSRSKENLSVAKTVLKKLVERTFDEPDNQPFRGLGLIKLNDESPKICYFKVNERYENTLSKLDELSLCFSVDFDFDSQKKWYKIMAKKYPQSYKIMFGLGLTYHNGHKYAKALKCYQKVIQTNPAFTKTYEMILERCPFTKHQQKLCKSHCLRLMMEEPNNINAMMISVRHNDCHQIKDLIIKHILEINPNYVPALFMKCCMSDNKFNHLQQSRKCYEANKDNLDFRLLYGLALIKANRQKQARKILTEQGIDKASRDLKTEAYSNIGDMYMKFWKHFSAIYWFEKAHKQENSPQKIYYRLANVYVITEQYRKGENICREYFQKFNNKKHYFDRNMRFLLIVANLKMGNHIIAQELINKFYEKFRDEEIFYQAADIYGQQFKYAESEYYLLKYIEKSNNKNQGQSQLAILRQKLNNRTEQLPLQSHPKQ